MDKRTLLQLLLFSVVIITGCSKYEDEDYSCNKEVNQWAKSNLNEIKKMKVAEWYSINDIVYQKAAYVAFDSNQRKELWLSKLQETLKLDWTNAEKEHISKLIYLIAPLDYHMLVGYFLCLEKKPYNYYQKLFQLPKLAGFGQIYSKPPRVVLEFHYSNIPICL